MGSHVSIVSLSCLASVRSITLVRSSDETVVKLLLVEDSIRSCKTSSNAVGFAGAAQLAELRLSMETLRQVAL